MSTTKEVPMLSEAWIVAHVSLILTVVGTVLNLLTFVILCQSTFRNMKARPTLHYMRAIAIFDILMLYGWNLDHYMSVMHGYTIAKLSIGSCRFFSFLNYFAGQVSAWLRVFVCLDRYLSLSRLRRTWFSHSKNVLIIIGCIILGSIIINCQFFFVGCSYNSNGSISTLSSVFDTYPLWDYIQLVVYNCIPFIAMVSLNSGVIYHLIHLRRTTMIQNSRIQHRSISITLVVTTFLFLFMTIPVTVGFAFFSAVASKTVLHLMDACLYTYHASSFLLYMITFEEFRQEFIRLIVCKKKNHQVVPQTITGTVAQGQTPTKILANS